jgi:HIRAN domain-containing protein
MVERRQVTLSKPERETPVGRELISLLTELSADGNVSREEMERLRAWLEVDRGIEFPALPFLHETIEQISADGEVTEDELDRLALAIERVLPKEIRLAAAATRKQARETRRTAERERKRQATITARAEKRAAQAAARVREGVLYRSEFAVRGAFRSEERREACERLIEGDTVTLEREPDNAHDSNAVLVLGDADCELGYVPREEGRKLAPLLDAGAEADGVVRRLWETPEGQIVPILLVKVRRGDADASISEQPRGGTVLPPQSAGAARRKTAARSGADARRGCGCGAAVCVALLFLVFLMLLRVG